MFLLFLSVFGLILARTPTTGRTGRLADDVHFARAGLQFFTRFFLAIVPSSLASVARANCYRLYPLSLNNLTAFSSVSRTNIWRIKYSWLSCFASIIPCPFRVIFLIFYSLSRDVARRIHPDSRRGSLGSSALFFSSFSLSGLYFPSSPLFSLSFSLVLLVSLCAEEKFGCVAWRNREPRQIYDVPGDFRYRLMS